MAEHEHIGYLVRSKHVRCRDCEGRAMSNQQSTASLFRVNIGHYGQACHECGATLHIAMPGWPELFSTDGCPTCERQVEVGPPVLMPYIAD